MTQFTLAAPGDTWGISGPTFLGLYWVLTAATIVVVLIIRRTIREQVRAAGSSTRLDDDPYLVAYLNGGPRLALTAALAALRTAGLVRRQFRYWALTEAVSGQSRPPLERQILVELPGPTGSLSRASLADRDGIATVMMRLHDDLVELRLLMSGRHYDRYRRSGWLLVAPCVLGLVRLIAGGATGHPVTYLAVSTAVFVLVTLLIMTRRPPRRTVLGDKELARLRNEHDDLAPEHRPDWTAHGATAAALAVGVFGVSAVYAAGPAFADELLEGQLSGLSGGSHSGGWWSSGGGGGSGYGVASGYGCGTGAGGGCGSGGSGGGGGGCGGGGCGG